MGSIRWLALMFLLIGCGRTTDVVVSSDRFGGVWLEGSRVTLDELVERLDGRPVVVRASGCLTHFVWIVTAACEAGASRIAFGSPRRNGWFGVVRGLDDRPGLMVRIPKGMPTEFRVSVAGADDLVFATAREAVAARPGAVHATIGGHGDASARRAIAAIHELGRSGVREIHLYGPWPLAWVRSRAVLPVPLPRQWIAFWFYQPFDWTPPLVPFAVPRMPGESIALAVQLTPGGDALTKGASRTLEELDVSLRDSRRLEEVRQRAARLARRDTRLWLRADRNAVWLHVGWIVAAAGEQGFDCVLFDVVTVADSRYSRDEAALAGVPASTQPPEFRARARVRIECGWPPREARYWDTVSPMPDAEVVVLHARWSARVQEILPHVSRLRAKGKRVYLAEPPSPTGGRGLQIWPLPPPD